MQIVENSYEASHIQTLHIPVMVNEVLQYISPKCEGYIVDCTLGLGGHTKALLKSNEKIQILAIDRDSDAINQARITLSQYNNRIIFIHDDFRNLENILNQNKIEKVSGILADLGVSSWQLGTPERGFSFQQDGPLDMRMDNTKGITAAELVNNLSEKELANLIYNYGEEKFSRRIAYQIVLNRTQSPILTTTQLVDIIHQAIPYKGKQNINPATRTFQALRIAVNKELDELDKFVSQAIDHLNPGGKLAIITFHSLEDRLIKWAMKREANLDNRIQPIIASTIQTRIKILTKKPLTASDDEISSNPRARSAKLRICERLE